MQMLVKDGGRDEPVDWLSLVEMLDSVRVRNIDDNVFSGGLLLLYWLFCLFTMLIASCRFRRE